MTLTFICICVDGPQMCFDIVLMAMMSVDNAYVAVKIFTADFMSNGSDCAYPTVPVGVCNLAVHPIRNTTTPGGWFNIKITSYQYRKSHCGDKTILRPSYLHNGISYTDKITSLY